jgi:predicted SprT family Zn-dependent metalloprotease
MTRKQQVIDKFNDLVAVSNDKFSMVLPSIKLRFDLKGCSAGQAVVKNGEYSVRFNMDMINGSGFEHILNDTVAHELAHIVAHIKKYGFKHDKYWRMFCISLGGSGDRCHTETVTPARKIQKYLYDTECGNTIIISKIRHNRIQNENKVYRIITGGILIKNSWRLA